MSLAFDEGEHACEVLELELAFLSEWILAWDWGILPVRLHPGRRFQPRWLL
jgi:hypothetical protein